MTFKKIGEQRPEASGPKPGGRGDQLLEVQCRHIADHKELDQGKYWDAGGKWSWCICFCFYRNVCIYPGKRVRGKEGSLGEGQREKESQADSPLSVEPNARLFVGPEDHPELKPRVGRSTD